MKQYFKGYHMFLPSSHILALFFLYLIYPLLLIGVGVGLRRMTMFSYICFTIVGMALLFAEAILDHFTFGGIQSRQVNYLEYIKTSARGKRFVNNAIKVDFLRRTVLIVLVLCISYLIANKGANKEEVIPTILLIKGILITCCFVQLQIVCSRFISNIWACFAISYVICSIYSVVQLLTKDVSYQSILCIAYAIGYVLLVVLTYYFSNRGLEGSYYDR